MQFERGQRKTRIMGWFLFQRALWRVFLNYMLCFRKFMAFTVKVFPLRISLLSSAWASALFEFLPLFLRKQLLLHPESDDSAQLSQIETEKLLAQLVETDEQVLEGRHLQRKEV